MILFMFCLHRILIYMYMFKHHDRDPSCTIKTWARVPVGFNFLCRWCASRTATHWRGQLPCHEADFPEIVTFLFLNRFCSNNDHFKALLTWNMNIEVKILNLKDWHVQLFGGLVFRITGKRGLPWCCSFSRYLAGHNYCHVSSLFCHENT